MPAVNLYLSDENYEFLKALAGSGGKLSAAANRALDVARALSPGSELMARAEARARRKGIPLSKYVEEALADALKRDMADLVKGVDIG